MSSYLAYEHQNSEGEDIKKPPAVKRRSKKACTVTRTKRQKIDDTKPDDDDNNSSVDSDFHASTPNQSSDSEGVDEDTENFTNKEVIFLPHYENYALI